MAQAVADTHRTIRDGREQFHRNLRWFLDQLWPGRPFDDKLRHVWITEGRLCSVTVEAGGCGTAPVPTAICGPRSPRCRGPRWWASVARRKGI
jgi:hypothetical protein